MKINMETETKDIIKSYLSRYKKSIDVSYKSNGEIIISFKVAELPDFRVEITEHKYYEDEDEEGEPTFLINAICYLYPINPFDTSNPELIGSISINIEKTQDFCNGVNVDKTHDFIPYFYNMIKNYYMVKIDYAKTILKRMDNLNLEGKN